MDVPHVANDVRALRTEVAALRRQMKRQAEALRVAEDKYREAWDHSASGRFRTTPDGRILAANKVLAVMLGYDSPDALMAAVSHVAKIYVEPQHRTDMMELIRENGRLEGIEYSLYRRDGQVIWVSETARAVCDANGTVRHFEGSLVDITERKRAEDALRVSEARYRGVVEGQTEMICRYRPDGVVTFANEPYARSVDRAVDGVVGWSFMSLLPEEELVRLRAHLTRLTPERPTGVFEHRMRMPSGEVRWRQWNDRGLFDLDGRLVEIQSVGRDVTDRRLAEMALRESEARYRAVVESQTEMICRYRPDCTLTFVNEAYCRMLGKTREELLGRSFLPFVVGDDSARVAQMTASLTPDHPVVTVEQRTHVRSGELCWQQWTDRGLFDDRGTLIEIQSVGRDVTDRRQAEEELRLHRDHLEELVQERTADLTRINALLRAEIAERHRTQEALAESEANYRRIVETADEGIWVADAEMRTTLVNRRMASMLGYAEAEMLGRPVSDFVPEIKHVAAPFDPNAHRRTDHTQMELRLRRREGSTFWALISANPILDESGREVGVLGMVTDVDARVRAGRERDEQRRMLQALLDTLPDIIIFKDLDSVFRVYNTAAARRLGFEGRNLIGGSDADVFRPEEVARFRAEEVRVMRTGRAMTVQHLIDTPMGPRLVEALKAPLRDEQGRVIGLLTTERDITERRRAEEREAAARRMAETRATVAQILQAQQPLAERFAAVLAHISGPGDDIAVLELAGDGLPLRKLSATGGAWDCCDGMQLDKCVSSCCEGGVVLPLTHAGQTLGLLCLRANLLAPVASEQSGTAAETGRSAPGRERLELLRQVSELMGLAIANERLTAETQRARLEAEEASRAKSVFLASMSHELRTPLNTVLGLSEALQESTFGPLTERQLSALRTMEQSGRHLLSLITDILDFSKMEAGKLDLEIAPVAVAGVCRDSLRLVRGLAIGKQLKISLEIDDPTIIVRADARRLMQILVNLLSNAIKFTPEGGRIGLRVTSAASGPTADEESGMVRLTVWDTGMGIAPEDQRRLFRPFVQLDGALSRQFSGTGLGLSLVRGMTEMQGGRVEVSSEEGKGSQFTVVLPLRSA